MNRGHMDTGHMDTVTLIFFHGGQFVRNPNLQYLGGQCTEYFENLNELCISWLFDLAKNCGNYRNIEGVYFLVPGMSLDFGLKRVVRDADVRDIVLLASLKQTIALYVAHEVHEHELSVNLSPLRLPEPNVLEKLTTKKGGITNNSNSSPSNQISQSIPPTTMGQRPESPNPWNDLNCGYESNSEDSDYEAIDKSPYDHPLSDKSARNSQEKGKQKPVKGGEVIIGESGSDTNDGTTDDDNEHTIVSQSDASDDEFIHARERLIHWNKTKDASLEKVTHDILSIHGRNVIVHESEFENSESDTYLESGSDGETVPQQVTKRKIPIVNQYTNFKTFRWCLGMRFPNREAFRDAAIRYGVAQGFRLRICRSDKERGGRLGIACEGNCPFRLYASWEGKRACYVLKSIKQDHECHRDMHKNSCFKSKWAANEFIEVFKEKPHWPASEIVNAVRRKYGIIITRGVAYKIKYIAHRMLHGSMFEHYSKIGSYLAALKHHNSSIDIDLVTIPDHDILRNPPMFQRLYLCFDALRVGFLEGCRPVLCLDGSFLKTYLGGVLLTAIGRDGNDQMFPVAWAITEGENNDSWEWFVGNLKKSFKGADDECWTFMSDEHKSIKYAVHKLFPKAEHRHCARHIYQHWKRTYKGDELKMHFWNAVRAYNLADFNQAIEDMAQVSSPAAEAFKALSTKTFCRAFLKTKSICDIVVNNMAETFNGWIIHARSKHILYMLEDIRCQVMERLNLKSSQMQTWNIICPRVQDKLEKEKDEARICFPKASAFMVFQVPHKLDTLVVDLHNRTCTCRKWDLSGIPCCHAVACAFYLRHKAEDYVSDYLKKATYIKSYSSSIAPCPGERHWPTIQLPMQPPPLRASPGRPKKNRRKDPYEDPKRQGKLTKHGQVMHCSICKSVAHTKRTCPDKDKIIQPTPKKPRGRPRKNPVSLCETTTEPSILHATTAEPSRRGKGRGRGRGAGNIRGGSGNTRRGKVPMGYGIYIDEQGRTFTNTMRQHGPVSNTTVSLMSSQESITQTSFSQPR